MTQRVFSEKKNQATMLAPKKTCKILQRRDMETQKGHGDTKPKIEMTSCQCPGLCENEGNEGTKAHSTQNVVANVPLCRFVAPTPCF